MKQIWAATLLAALTSAHAQNVETITSRALLVFPAASPDQAVEAMTAGLSHILSTPRRSVKFLPSPLPAVPDGPRPLQRLVGSVAVPDLDCGTAYAEFTYAPAASGNQLGGYGSFYRACLYAFQGGFRAHLLMTNYRVGRSGIGSMIVGGLQKAMQGDDRELAAKGIKEAIAKVKERAPGTLVEMIEVPGAAREEPDLAEVRKVLPEFVASVRVAPSEVPAVATTGVAAAPSVPAAAVDARKSLHAMGLTYHSQEQFFAAIRRKDAIAVQLFVAGGGVDLESRDGSGKTPAEVAVEVGAAGLVPVLTPATGGRAVTQQASAAPPAPLQATAQPTPDRMFKLSPLAKMALGRLSDTELDQQATALAMNFPAEKRHLVKQQIVEDARRP